MRIHLIGETSNVVFGKRSARQYVMYAEPERYYPSASELSEGAQTSFLFGQVRLWVINREKTRLIHVYRISRPYFDEAEYQKAVTGGFTVQKGAERAARWLIAHELARRVDEA